MQRTGPESLMLMAAAPIAYRAETDREPLWQLPARVQEDGRDVAPLALCGVAPRPSAGRRLLGWLGRGAEAKSLARLRSY